MPASKIIKNVLFDLDGTLADTAPDLAYALNCLLQEQGQAALPLEAIRPVVSLGSIAMVRLAFNVDESSTEFDALKKRFLQIYRDNIARHTRLFEGMEQVLACLDSEQLAWGIVTNKPGWLTEPLIAELGLHERTPCIVSGDTVEHAKPHPAPLLYACKLLSCNAKETLYVGDAKRDIEAGKRAEMTTLVASYGYIDENDEPETWAADGFVTTPLQILDWLT